MDWLSSIVVANDTTGGSYLTVAIGKVQYVLGTGNVIGLGLALNVGELDAALDGPVKKIVFDEESKADFRALLEAVPNTEFDSSEVKRILEEKRRPENWRVGEALAEAYLVSHRACTFPWPDGRDERKSGSSLPGADLAGFELNAGTDRFAFGEIKTSSENEYPPGTMYPTFRSKDCIAD